MISIRFVNTNGQLLSDTGPSLTYIPGAVVAQDSGTQVGTRVFVYMAGKQSSWRTQHHLPQNVAVLEEVGEYFVPLSGVGP